MELHNPNRVWKRVADAVLMSLWGQIFLDYVLFMQTYGIRPPIENLPSQ